MKGHQEGSHFLKAAQHFDPVEIRHLSPFGTQSLSLEIWGN